MTIYLKVNIEEWHPMEETMETRPGGSTGETPESDRAPGRAGWLDELSRKSLTEVIADLGGGM